MKRVLAILFFVPFVMALAPPCHAAGNGEVAASLVDVPAELRERSVLVTLGSGPNDTDTVLVTLNSLNQYSQTVTLPEGTYYCNAAVQYDALNDWPLREVDGTTFLQVEAGGQYELQYEFAGESWFTEVTGQTRYYTPLPLRQPPADYQPTTAQVSAYLTAPVSFSQHCIVYLQNLYSGTVYALDVYESNQLAAVCTEADSGLYTFLSARVAGDAAERYQFHCEQKELNTDDGASFHLTVSTFFCCTIDFICSKHDFQILDNARMGYVHQIHRQLIIRRCIVLTVNLGIAGQTRLGLQAQGKLRHFFTVLGCNFRTLWTRPHNA